MARSPDDHRVRPFYFVFTVLLYNTWRLTDLLPKAGVDGEMDYAPVLTAGERIEIVVSALIPPDRPGEPLPSPQFDGGSTVRRRQNTQVFSRSSDRRATVGSISMVDRKETIRVDSDPVEIVHPAEL